MPLSNEHKLNAALFIHSALSTQLHRWTGLSTDGTGENCQAAGLEWDNEKAHSALYDAEKKPSCFVDSQSLETT